jgi:cytochrome c biogenesis protein CcdA
MCYIQPKNDSKYPSTEAIQDQEELILIDNSNKILNNKASKEAKQGSLFQTFLLDRSSALVASPCATLVLTSI